MIFTFLSLPFPSLIKFSCSFLSFNSKITVWYVFCSLSYPVFIVHCCFPPNFGAIYCCIVCIEHYCFLPIFGAIHCCIAFITSHIIIFLLLETVYSNRRNIAFSVVFLSFNHLYTLQKHKHLQRSGFILSLQFWLYFLLLLQTA